MLIYSRQADWLVALEIFTMIILHVFITTSLSFFSVPSFTMQNFGVETSRFMLWIFACFLDRFLFLMRRVPTQYLIVILVALYPFLSMPLHVLKFQLVFPALLSRKRCTLFGDHKVTVVLVGGHFLCHSSFPHLLLISTPIDVVALFKWEHQRRRWDPEDAIGIGQFCRPSNWRVGVPYWWESTSFSVQLICTSDLL